VTVLTCRVLLNVADIDASLGFWRDLIGFEVVDRFDHEGQTVFASLRSGDVQLMLNARGGDPAPRRTRPHYTEAVIYLGVESVHDLVAALRARGQDAHDPEPQEYGVDEITLRDPDGYEIAFTSPKAR
jgi:catechol 2,3-dioxygenase-like lactoylglutathione lyase family enzyme